jgi:hypothetical protein
VYESDVHIAVIGQDNGKRAKALWAKTLIGDLACLPVDSFVGDVVEPLSGLAVDVGKIGEGA